MNVLILYGYVRFSTSGIPCGHLIFAHDSVKSFHFGWKECFLKSLKL